MSDFAIDPPVHLNARPQHAIRSLDEAADVVREYARDHFNPDTEGVLHRLEGAITFDEAKDAANAFRAWADSKGFLLIPPDDR
jgi:hypothetical protein